MTPSQPAFCLLKFEIEQNLFHDAFDFISDSFVLLWTTSQFCMPRSKNGEAWTGWVDKAIDLYVLA